MVSFRQDADREDFPVSLTLLISFSTCSHYEKMTAALEAKRSSAFFFFLCIMLDI